MDRQTPSVGDIVRFVSGDGTAARLCAGKKITGTVTHLHEDGKTCTVDVGFGFGIYPRLDNIEVIITREEVFELTGAEDPCLQDQRS